MSGEWGPRTDHEPRSRWWGQDTASSRTRMPPPSCVCPNELITAASPFRRLGPAASGSATRGCLSFPLCQAVSDRPGTSRGGGTTREQCSHDVLVTMFLTPFNRPRKVAAAVGSGPRTCPRCHGQVAPTRCSASHVKFLLMPSMALLLTPPEGQRVWRDLGLFVSVQVADSYKQSRGHRGWASRCPCELYWSRRWTLGLRWWEG